MGRWSALVAEQFVRRLALPPQQRWLDVGCGTGALTRAVLARAQPAAVTGVDRSPEFVGFARERTASPLASFLVGDATQIPVQDHSFDAAISGLVLNFIPEPQRMLSEMIRATRPTGTVAVYVWDYPARMEMLSRFWEAAAALDPIAGARDERTLFAVCNPVELARLFTTAGLRDVATAPLEITTEFRSFDDYWTPFLAGQGPTGSYVTSLDEPRRSALRERLRTALAAPGRLSMPARAWACSGIRP
jgi:SAM-dependent methyltransferase